MLPCRQNRDRGRSSVSVVTNCTQLKEERMRMWRNAAWVAVLTAVGGGLFAGMVEGRTALTPFDFTGHWIGCVDCPRFGGRLMAFAISSGVTGSSRS